MLNINFSPSTPARCRTKGKDQTRPEARGFRLRASKIAGHTLVFKFRANKIPSHLARARGNRRYPLPFVQETPPYMLRSYFADRPPLPPSHRLDRPPFAPLRFIFSGPVRSPFISSCFSSPQLWSELAPQCSLFFTSCCLPILRQVFAGTTFSNRITCTFTSRFRSKIAIPILSDLIRDADE